eukprot:9490598-Pyramimonas_sp.AAC.1
MPARIVPYHSVLITVAEEKRGHLPKWGHPRDSDSEETFHVPMCSIVDDYSYGLDLDENGQYVEHCFMAEMSRLVLSEQQHVILDADRATSMRVCCTAAAKRAAVVKEDGFPPRADVQANPEKVLEALNTESKTRSGNKRHTA